MEAVLHYNIVFVIIGSNGFYFRALQGLKINSLRLSIEMWILRFQEAESLELRSRNSVVKILF
jgi:hypothetical protein